MISKKPEENNHEASRGRVKRLIKTFEQLDSFLPPSTNLTKSKKIPQKTKARQKNSNPKIQMNLFEIADEYRRKKRGERRVNPTIITNKVLESYRQELNKNKSFTRGIIKQLMQYEKARFPARTNPIPFVKLYDNFMQEIEFVTEILQTENKGKIVNQKTAINALMNSFNTPLAEELSKSIQQIREYERTRWPNNKRYNTMYKISEAMHNDMMTVEKSLQKKIGNSKSINGDELLKMVMRIFKKRQQRQNSRQGRPSPAFHINNNTNYHH